MTLEEVYSDWSRWKRRDAAGTSMEVYRRRWRHLSMLGSRNVESLCARDWRDMAETLMDGGCSVKTAQAADGMGRTLMGYAEAELGLRVQTKWRVSWPRRGCKGRRLEIYTDDEARRIVATAACHDGSGFHLLAVLGFLCGLREGELCGLRLDDVDLGGMTLYVGRTSSRERGRGVVLHPPKTASSERRVPLVGWVAEWLAELGKGLPSCSYIGRISRRGGALMKAGLLAMPMDTRTFRSRWRTLTKESGVRYLNPHAMRHKFASSLVENGADVKTTQTLLGHANASTTLNTYCHASDGAKRQAVETGVNARYGMKKYPKCVTFRIFPRHAAKGG